MSRIGALLGVVGVLALCGAARLQAHHSFAMFDTTKPVTLTGKVTQFQWTNPHAYIEIDVPDGTSPPKHWTVELGQHEHPDAGRLEVQRREAGRQTITVVISPLRNGQPAGLLGAHHPRRRSRALQRARSRRRRTAVTRGFASAAVALFATVVATGLAAQSAAPPDLSGAWAPYRGGRAPTRSSPPRRQRRSC